MTCEGNAHISNGEGGAGFVLTAAEFLGRSLPTAHFAVQTDQADHPGGEERDPG